MKYAYYDDASGDILGYYDESVHDHIPSPNIKLSDDEWRDCINNNGARCIDVTPGNAPAVIIYATPPKPVRDVATDKITELSSACETAITSGFTSAALGVEHTYQSDRDDQLNLVGASTAGVDMAFKCRDANGVWAYRPHTAAQLAQVHHDGAAIKLSHLQRFGDKKDQVIAIADAPALTDDEKRAAIEAVVW